MSEFALDQLKLAFAYDIVRKILGADGAVGNDEERFLARMFPASTLESSGFFEDGAFTTAFDRALKLALTELPKRLDQAAKLELLETFLEASLADDQMHHTESTVLMQAAERLGIAPGTFDRHLDTLDNVGSIDLDEPIGE